MVGGRDRWASTSVIKEQLAIAGLCVLALSISSAVTHQATNLGLASALLHCSALQDPVELKTAILIYRREGIQAEMDIPGGVAASGKRVW